MSTVTRTPEQMVAEASAILREVREAEWPQDRHAQHAIGWAYASAGDALETYTAVLNGDLDPWKVSPPDLMAGDPEEHALEWAADAYLEAAKAARNRLAEWQRKGEKS